MKNAFLIWVLVFVAQMGCVNPATNSKVGAPIPIIVIPSSPEYKTVPTQYVLLKLPYGLIINNNDYPTGAPLFYFFDRDQKRIVKTKDVNVLLAELKKIPDGSIIDLVSKCTVAFYNQYGVNIDAEYERISSLLKQKQFKLVQSIEDDERHASFCYCEGGFRILDESTSLK